MYLNYNYMPHLMQYLRTQKCGTIWTLGEPKLRIPTTGAKIAGHRANIFVGWDMKFDVFHPEVL